MKSKINLIIFCIYLISTSIYSQFNYSVSIDTFRIPNWPNIHSFTYGIVNESIYMFGGRLDGIHDKNSGFENKFSNDQIYRWNTKTQTITQYSLDSLLPSMIEPLSAANAAFTQVNNQLMIIGGYGQSKTGAYKTYPSLITIDLAKLDQAIASNQNIGTAFKQIIDDTFAVAGGQLEVLDQLYYLTGGHRFEGIYKDSSLVVNQRYTSACRIFNIDFSGDTLSIDFKKEIVDEFNFHRRDFNLSPFIMQDRNEKLMCFAGVFLVNENRPFMNLAAVNYNGYEDIPDFNQRFANYTCPHVGFYSDVKNEMHKVFFGGMAEYYRDTLDQVVRDPFVPFVKSISSISRRSDGTFQETLLKEKMPAYLGTNSEIFLNPQLPYFKNKIINLDSIQKDSTWLGYIFGGIYNPLHEANPFEKNKASLTLANPYIINLQLIKNNSTQVQEPNSSVQQNKFEWILSPNPATNKISIISPNINIETLSIWITNASGKLVHYEKLDHHSTINIASLPAGMYQIYALLNGTAFNSKMFYKID